MHVHELNPFRTTIVMIIFASIIVVGLLTIKTPRLKYELSPENTISMLKGENGYFLPSELEELLSEKKNDILLIDIRNNFVFGRGHIQGAENISAVNLLNEENIKRLEKLKTDGVSVVLYANNQLEANGPWMVLRQLGFNNVKILLGGYDFYTQKNILQSDSISENNYLLGTPKFNYAEIFESSVSISEEPKVTKTVVKVNRKKKSSVREGGC